NEHVIKYHRTLAKYVNTVMESGFQLTKIMEPEPLAAMVAERPDWKDECRRPMFLLIAAVARE
ncbi:MAG TPA: SAM-dependent methyltransferase, partial [Bryobacteraceae bacterium]